MPSKRKAIDNKKRHKQFAIATACGVFIGFILYFAVIMVAALMNEPGTDGSWLSVILVPLLFLLSNIYFLAIVAVVLSVACYVISYATRALPHRYAIRFVGVAAITLVLGAYFEAQDYSDFVLAALIGPLAIAGLGFITHLPARFKF